MARHTARRPVALLVAAAAVAALAAPALAAARPQGAVKPPTGSGIGTAAAMERPECRTDDPTQQPYGLLDSPLEGQGQVCVKPWGPDDDNGGATSKGVTADSITLVAVVPGEAQATATGATQRATNSKGRYQDAVHDILLAYMRYFETWGRSIDMRLVEPSGTDEASQRADALKIKAMEPFAVMDIVPAGLDVLVTDLAQDGIVTFSYSTSAAEAEALAPYRWGHSDTQAAGINAAEIAGKHLAKKKAQYAGDALQGETRKFGTVYVEDIIDVDGLKSSMQANGATLAVDASYEATGSTLGDPATAQPQAPVIVQRMKEAGVTTVLLFTDVAMTRSLMEQASQQDWYPEWFFTGTLFVDLPLLARSYPAEQMAHGFGNSTLSPWVVANPSPTEAESYLGDPDGALNWYWGEAVGTTSPGVGQGLPWIMRGIHAAGPKLTPKTFEQGLFSVAARGGAAWNQPIGTMIAYGKTAGLPYAEYMGAGADFGVFWWDSETTGPGAGTGTEGAGVTWYVNDGKRYRAGAIPNKPFKYFDESNSVFMFETRPVPTPPLGLACTGCPSQGGPGTPSTPSMDGFVAPYVGYNGGASAS